MDAALVMLALPIVLPMMAMIALSIRAVGRGPILSIRPASGWGGSTLRR